MFLRLSGFAGSMAGVNSLTCFQNPALRVPFSSPFRGIEEALRDFAAAEAQHVDLPEIRVKRSKLHSC